VDGRGQGISPAADHPGLQAGLGSSPRGLPRSGPGGRPGPPETGRFVTEVLRKGRAPATTSRLLTSLSSFWRWMIKRGLDRRPSRHVGWTTSKGAGHLSQPVGPKTSASATVWSRASFGEQQGRISGAAGKIAARSGRDMSRTASHSRRGQVEAVPVRLHELRSPIAAGALVERISRIVLEGMKAASRCATAVRFNVLNCA
jgi:hypothetical protein